MNATIQSSRSVASRRFSSQTRNVAVVAVAVTSSSGRSIFEGSGRDSYTCRSLLHLRCTQMHWIEFTEMVLHLRIAILSSASVAHPVPRSRETFSNVNGNIDFPRFATYFLEINSWNVTDANNTRRCSVS